MILLKNCYCVFVGLPKNKNILMPTKSNAGAFCKSSVDLFIDKNRIIEIGPNLDKNHSSKFNKMVDRSNLKIIDASKHVVLPGLVNTHHHFYQTLTRALPQAQSAKLFDWLVTLYEVWKGIDEDAVYWSTKLALSELIKTGCTLSTDHHYLYPKTFKQDLPGIQFKAASELGIRFSPTRGSMSRYKKDGGLPPDSVVQEEDKILELCEDSLKKYHCTDIDSMQKVALAPCSPFSVSEQSLKDSVSLARKYKAQLHTHLAETEDENEFCLSMYKRRPLKLMEDCGFIGRDTWYAHGIHFNDAELKILSETQTGVAHCPASNMRLGSGIARVREMLDLGIPVGLGVDGSASNDSSDLLGEARNALLLQRVKYGASEFSTAETLGLASEGGAKLLGYEILGRIEENYLADLALFDVHKLEYAGSLSDPAAALVLCGYNHGADYVISNGKLILENTKLVGVDEEQIRSKACGLSNKLLKAANLV